MYIEDRLQEFYHRSRLVAEMLADSTMPMPPAHLAGALGIDASDVPFLVALSGVHMP